jgi:hypothetical protein
MVIRYYTLRLGIDGNMGEKKKRVIVASVFYALALVAFAAGALASWRIYETTADPRNRWMLCDCCYGECVCQAPPLLLGVLIAAFMVLVSLGFTALLLSAGASYYTCGRLQCTEEYVEEEGWGE